MTLEEALRKSGIQVTEADAWGGCKGLTTNGKRFQVEKACGTFNEFTVNIEGQNRVAHCLIRTAIKKIKIN